MFSLALTRWLFLLCLSSFSYCVLTSHPLIAADAPAIPSARAIQERFQKIRKQANQNVAASGVAPIPATATTPRAPRGGRAPNPPKTPVSTAKKRKTKKAAPVSESSDGENHLTPSDDESPSKAAKTRVVKAPGSAFRAGGGGQAKAPAGEFNVGAFDGMSSEDGTPALIMGSPFTTPTKDGKFFRSISPISSSSLGKKPTR